MVWSPTQGPDDLRLACGRFDDYAVKQLCDAAMTYVRNSAEPYGRDAALEILAILRSCRYFVLLRDVGRTFIEQGQRAPGVQRHYAQSLIEEGAFFDAERVLDAASADAERLNDSAELGEARGLLGRVFKQRYVVSDAAGRARPEDLRRAVRFYLDTYAVAPTANLWHGINGVALLLRARADGVDVGESADPRIIARRVLARVEEKFGSNQADAWDKATAMEACLALDDAAGSAIWVMRYISDIEGSSQGLERADSFKFASTRRQLIEVWRLNRSREPGSLLLPPLDAATLGSRDGSIRRSPADLKREVSETDPTQVLAGFEARHGYRWLPTQWMDTGTRRAARVARIAHRETGVTKGTAFLIHGSDLDSRFGDRPVVLTNSHVVSKLDEVHSHPDHNPLSPREARVHFEMVGQSFACDQILWESPPWLEDTTVLAVDPSVQIDDSPYPIFSKPLAVGGTESIFIIGYPADTTRPQISFENNRLLEANKHYLRYRTPTDGGSSGSPLFDASWRLVGIHHRTSDAFDSFTTPGAKLAANQGVWIKRIQVAIAEAQAQA